MRGELDWIVLKALEKERARRYETASALAEDVKRHLAGEPVVAAPVSRAYRVRKFVRRNRGAVGAISAVMVALAAGGSVAAWQYVSAERQALVAGQNAARALLAQDDAEWSAYTANLALAQAAFRTGDWLAARRLVSATVESKRGWEWQLIHSMADSVRWSSARLPFDRPSRQDRFTSLSADGRVTLDDANTGSVIVDVGRVGLQTQIADTARMLFVNHRDGTVKQYDLDTGQLLHSLRLDQSMTLGLVSTCANRAFAESADNVLSLIALPDGRMVGRVDHPRGSGPPSWSFRAGGRFALLARDATANIYDAHNGALIKTVEGQQVSFGLNGMLCAIWTSNNHIDIYDTSSWKVVRTLHLDGSALQSADFYEQSATLLTTHADGQVRLWDIDSDRTPLVCETRAGWTPLYSPQAGRFVTVQAFRDKTSIWDTSTAMPVAVVQGTPVGMDRNGEVLITRSSDGQLYWAWDTQSGSLTGRFQNSSSSTDANAMVIGSTLLMANRQDNALRGTTDGICVRSVGSPEVTISFRDMRRGIGRLRMQYILGDLATQHASQLTIDLLEGSRRIIAETDGRLRVVAIGDEAQREVAVFRMPEAVTNLQMTGDGTRLVIHLADGSARVWDIRDPEERRKDLQAEWAERVPAGAYLDTLWAGDTADDKLQEAVINDASLTPLRRLVAAEMLEERLEDDRIAADRALEQMKQAAVPDGTTPAADPASITNAVRAAAAAAELPKRVKARVVALAAGWEYKRPEPTAEQKLAEQNRQRRLAEAMNAVLEHEGLDLAIPTKDQVRRTQEALATFEEILGPRSLEACRARVQVMSGREGVTQEALLRARAELGLRNGDLFATFQNLWLIASSSGSGKSLTHPTDYAIQAMARWRAVHPNNEDRIERVNRWDVNPDGFTSGRVLTADEHRQLAREALAKARALMAPAPDGTPSPWANDQDAKALLAEAAALIEGAGAAQPATPAKEDR